MSIPLDIHTHKEFQVGQYWDSVRSFSYPFRGCPAEGYFSLGLHPMEETAFTDEALMLLSRMAENPDCLMIGEAGLDKRSTVSMPVQMDYLEAQVRLSENLRKPLVIHVVQKTNELIDLRHLLKPVQPWVIHGFRGKPQLARQLVQEGFYLSFGERFNEDSLRQVPLERLLLETDESKLSFDQILLSVASARNLSYGSLRKALEDNVLSLFPGRVF